MTSRMGEFFTSIFKAREARNALLLVIAGMVFLTALEPRQPGPSMLAEREGADKSTHTQATNISRANVGNSRAMSQDRHSIPQDVEEGRKPALRIKRFFLSALPWL